MNDSPSPRALSDLNTTHFHLSLRPWFRLTSPSDRSTRRRPGLEAQSAGGRPGVSRHPGGALVARGGSGGGAHRGPGALLPGAREEGARREQDAHHLGGQDEGGLLQKGQRAAADMVVVYGVYTGLGAK